LFFALSPYRFATLRTGRFRLNIILALGVVLVSTRLGSRLLKLRTYALPPQRMMFANVVSRGKSALFLCLRKTASTFHFTTAKKLRSFYFSEFHDCSLAYFGRGLLQLLAYPSQSFGYLLYIVNANCPTYPTLLPTRMFPPDGYCFHVSLNKRGISSQLVLEFSIRHWVNN